MGNGSKAELLFTYRSKTVTANVIGPRIGWTWTKVDYFRWVASTKQPGKWEKRPPDREVDQQSLQECVKAVRTFFKAREKARQQNYGRS